jgi:glycosyltransferase involved in cell wall biosynthesis
MYNADKMNILLTCDPEIPVPPGKYGGIERIVEMLVYGLVERGHHVTLCANGASKVPCKLVAWQGKKSQHLPDIIKNTLTLTTTVLKHKVDIIHSFSRLAYMGLVMPFPVPKIMSYQREPSVTQVKKANFIAAKNSLYFTGCSNYITQQIAPFVQATTIYNAAPFDKYDLKPTTDTDAPLVFLGRIEEIKGVREAILVAQKTGRRLVIAGNVPEEGKTYFETEVRPHLDDRIEYGGPVDDRQKNELLGTAAALLMPIQWNEPFGIVMAEAMACGTPVIGLARGAVPEVVEQGVTGFCCSSVEEMVLSVGKLSTINRRNVKSRASENFSAQAMVDKYVQLYNHILKAKKKK